MKCIPPIGIITRETAHENQSEKREKEAKDRKKKRAMNKKLTYDPRTRKIKNIDQEAAREIKKRRKRSDKTSHTN